MKRFVGIVGTKSICIFCNGTGWATPKAAKLHRLCLACFGSGVVLKGKQDNGLDRLVRDMDELGNALLAEINKIDGGLYRMQHPIKAAKNFLSKKIFGGK